MRIYKTKAFAWFARGERLPDASLTEAVERAQQGAVDADLGSGLIKQRVARQGHGRRGGYRTSIAIRSDSFAIFMFGFAKNERGNVTAEALTVLRHTSVSWLGSDTAGIMRAGKEGILFEVRNDSDCQG